MTHLLLVVDPVTAREHTPCAFLDFAIKQEELHFTRLVEGPWHPLEVTVHRVKRLYNLW